MTRGQTYYDVLGVEERATPEEIRAAYLRLIKQHHPDAPRPGQAKPNADMMPLINHTYAILRDPVKRAAYDCELRPRAHPPQPSFALAPKIHPNRARRISQRAPWIAGACFAGVFAANQLSASGALSALLNPFASLSANQQSIVMTLPPSTPPHDDIRREVHLAMTLSSYRAESHSRGCFDAAERLQSGISVELCVIFDLAFVYWKKAPPPSAALPPYFDDQVARFRHTAALAPFAGDSDAELDQLRGAAFRALLSEVRGSDMPVAQPPFTELPRVSSPTPTASASR